MKTLARVTQAALLAASMLAAVAAHATGDVAAGRDKAKGCANCHGADGKGRVPLAGKKADYLAEQLRAYRAGTRKEQMMNMLAKGLSDQDIADLAAYFASLK